ncbi:MAG: FAD-dependent thymidylate synthase [Ignavibacteria bacterium]|nr:FAD-dependent thymidylate synthase [Ignavibacteria bacterium]
MPRVIVSAAEEILEKEYKCLNHGFVRLIDYMGSDESIVQAARVSYGKGTKTIREDRTLIRYLMRHHHTTPFEMVELKFHVKLPIFVARQWIRHRTANVNEYSGRYSIMPEEFYLPEKKDIKPQSTTNRQGRSEEEIPLEIRQKVLNLLMEEQKSSFNGYNEMLESNVSRELARINLPLSLYTQWYWKIDLHNLFHFLRLRIDDHAQYEIRVYAKAMGEMVNRVAPLAWEAFEDYIFNSITLSKTELTALKEFFPEEIPNQKLEQLDLSSYEIAELAEKLKKIRKL